MPIEGPLRELGLHDLFQLLDLSRKTGALEVASSVRNNEGMVAFDRGSIVWAEIRSNPLRLGELLVKQGRIGEAELARALATTRREGGARRLGQVLVEMGAITEREMRVLIEKQITEVVFELLSWQEGFFSFSERQVSDLRPDESVRIPTESVLMEGARRIDEWSRIESLIPHLGVVPDLAPLDGQDAAPAPLDLLPDEWEVLTLVDGSRDAHTIARELSRSEFEVARTLYGLVSTGVIELRAPAEVSRSGGTPPRGVDGVLAGGHSQLAAGNVAGARESAALAAGLAPRDPRAHMLLARSWLEEGRIEEAVEEARLAVRLDPAAAEGRRWLALALARAGRFKEADEQFAQLERAAPPGADREAAEARAAVATLARLLEQGEGRG